MIGDYISRERIKKEGKGETAFMGVFLHNTFVLQQRSITGDHPAKSGCKIEIPVAAYM